MLCPMNHSEEKWCFTVVICGRMKLAQILLAMLNRLAEQWDCADFAPFSVQIPNCQDVVLGIDVRSVRSIFPGNIRRQNVGGLTVAIQV